MTQGDLNYLELITNGQSRKLAKCDYNTITAPTVNNDETEGYSRGSVRINALKNHAYICTDPSTGAAVWMKFDSSILATGTVYYNPLESRFANLISVDDFGDCTDDTADHSAIVQAAIDYAASMDKGIMFTSGRKYNILSVRLKDKPSPWLVEGNGATVNNPSLASTDEPCLYQTALAVAGSATTGFTYMRGVTIYNLNFESSNGFGVGYKQVIAGNMKLINCQFIDFESHVKSIGVSGSSIEGCRFIGASGSKLVHYARIADDSYSVNYTTEFAGWNDGVSVSHTQLNGGSYGIYYGGSSSEGVISIYDCVVTAQTVNAIYAEVFYSLTIEKLWTEFQDDAMMDLIHLAKNSNGFEPAGKVTISKSYFFVNKPLRYIVNNQSRMCDFIDNTVHSVNGSLQGVVYSNVGTSGRFNAPETLTPTSTAYMDSGLISFANADLTLGTKSMYYMTDGANKVILKPTRANTPSGSQEFTMYKYIEVWSPQWGHIGPNWINADSPHKRTAPTGHAIDFSTPLTGLAYSGQPVTLTNGIEGNGMTDKPITRIDDNTFIGVPSNTIYQQREFGLVTLWNNRKL